MGAPGTTRFGGGPRRGAAGNKTKEQNNEDGLCSCKLSWCTFIWMLCAFSFLPPSFSMYGTRTDFHQISKYLLPAVPKQDASLLEGHDFEEAGARVAGSARQELPVGVLRGRDD